MFKAAAIIFCVIGISVLSVEIIYADQVIMKDGRVLQGRVMSKSGQGVVLESSSGVEVIDHKYIDKVVITTDETPLQRVTARKDVSYWMKQAGKVAAGVVTQVKRIEPMHQSFMRWIERSPVYRSIMKVEEMKKFKKDNPTGFVMSIYCLVLFVLAIVLRMITEIYMFILGFFGVRSNK